jgi:hypothetical protein
VDRRKFQTACAAAATALALLSGCGGETRTATSDSGAPGQSVRTSSAPPVSGQSVEARRADFLNRVRGADPQQATIERALLNERNELGLILNRRANLDDVPKLMKAMLSELDKTFPGQDHTVVAYTPTNPPQTIGTARLNARTRDMTYTPASP